MLDLAENDRVKRTVAEIRDKVRGGGSLSDALEEQHGAFNRLFINMVRAGEIGGTLDVTLARLSDYLERSKDLKDSVISALIYPILLLILAAGSLILLLVYVIPQFTPIFEELGGDLPLITRIVLVVGEVVVVLGRTTATASSDLPSGVTSTSTATTAVAAEMAVQPPRRKAGRSVDVRIGRSTTRKLSSARRSVSATCSAASGRRASSRPIGAPTKMITGQCHR